MAWIESHQSLGNHPKLIRLAGCLKISKAQAVGHLHFLWWWALDYAPDGDLSKLSKKEIAGAATWDGDEKLFNDALHVTQWVNSDEKIHDWDVYRVHFELSKQRQERKREQIRKRVGNYREREKLKNKNSGKNVTHPVTLSNAATQHTQHTQHETLETNQLPKIGVSSSSYKIKTNIQQVVLGFKLKMRNDFNDKEWDQVYFPRFSKPAKDLLILFKNDVDTCLDCIEQVVNALEKLNRSWSPETIVKHAADWRNGRLFK